MERKYFSHFHIAGFTYWDGAVVFNKLKIGKKLTLVHEPDNRYDPKAVAIFYNDHKLGYIPQSCNSQISQLLEMGHNLFETRIQCIDGSQHPERQIGVVVYLKPNVTDNVD